MSSVKMPSDQESDDKMSNEKMSWYNLASTTLWTRTWDNFYVLRIKRSGSQLEDHNWEEQVRLQKVRSSYSSLLTRLKQVILAICIQNLI